jgi:uncharacterized protein (DUF111 family)
VPLADFAVEGELTTPTGAAIVAALADSFGPLPAMTIERIGYGAGQKDFAHPNLLRLLVGKTPGEPASAGGQSSAASPTVDSIVLLETNLDDVTGEQIGFAIERLWAADALDVSTAALTMKKNRPGVLLAVQCRPVDADELASIVFRETTALGLRLSTVSRLTLPRRSVTVETPFGPIAGIVATLPGGASRFSPEYEACAEAARRQGVALADVDSAAKTAYEAKQG